MFLTFTVPLFLTLLLHQAQCACLPTEYLCGDVCTSSCDCCMVNGELQVFACDALAKCVSDCLDCDLETDVNCIPPANSALNTTCVASCQRCASGLGVCQPAVAPARWCTTLTPTLSPLEPCPGEYFPREIVHLPPCAYNGKAWERDCLIQDTKSGYITTGSDDYLPRKDYVFDIMPNCARKEHLRVWFDDDFYVDSSSELDITTWGGLIWLDGYSGTKKPNMVWSFDDEVYIRLHMSTGINGTGSGFGASFECVANGGGTRPVCLHGLGFSSNRQCIIRARDHLPDAFLSPGHNGLAAPGTWEWLVETDCPVYQEGSIRVTFIELDLLPIDSIHVDVLDDRGKWNPNAPRQRITTLTASANAQTPVSVVVHRHASFVLNFTSGNSSVRRAGFLAHYECICRPFTDTPTRGVVLSSTPTVTLKAPQCPNITIQSSAAVSLADTLFPFCGDVNYDSDLIRALFSTPWTFGAAVSLVGDVDGDGFQDLAISHDTARMKQGVIFIVFLAENIGLPVDGQVLDGKKLKLAKPPMMVNSLIPLVRQDEQFGRSLAAIGDLDCDGVPDLAVGAGLNRFRGGFFIVFLTRSGRARDTVRVDTYHPLIAPLFNVMTIRARWASSLDVYGVVTGATGEKEIVLVVGGCPLPNDIMSSLQNEAVNPLGVVFVHINKAGQPTKAYNVGVPTALELPDGSKLNYCDRMSACGSFGCLTRIIGDVDGNGVLDLMTTGINWNPYNRQGVEFIMFMQNGGDTPYKVMNMVRYINPHKPLPAWEGSAGDFFKLPSAAWQRGTVPVIDMDMPIFLLGPNMEGYVMMNRYHWGFQDSGGTVYSMNTTASRLGGKNDEICNLLHPLSGMASYPRPSGGRRGDYVSNLGIAAANAGGVAFAFSFPGAASVVVTRIKGDVDPKTVRPTNAQLQCTPPATPPPTFGDCVNQRLNSLGHVISSPNQCRRPLTTVPPCAFPWAPAKGRHECMLSHESGILGEGYAPVPTNSNFDFVVRPLGGWPGSTMCTFALDGASTAPDLGYIKVNNVPMVSSNRVTMLTLQVFRQPGDPPIFVNVSTAVSSSYSSSYTSALNWIMTYQCGPAASPLPEYPPCAYRQASTSSTCILDRDAGFISDGAGRYIENVNRTWIIRSQCPQGLQFIPLDFDVEGDFDGLFLYEGDITAFNGDTSKMLLLAAWHGMPWNTPALTLGPTASLVFISEDALTFRGFSLEFTCRPACSDTVTMTSPPSSSNTRTPSRIRSETASRTLTHIRSVTPSITATRTVTSTPPPTSTPILTKTVPPTLSPVPVPIDASPTPPPPSPSDQPVPPDGGNGSYTIPPPPPPGMCVLSNWSLWSTCSSGCGPGNFTRMRRVLVQPADPITNPCPTPLVEVKPCEAPACTCPMLDWGPWSPCSEPCGGGWQESIRYPVDRSNPACSAGHWIQPCGMEPCTFITGPSPLRVQMDIPQVGVFLNVPPELIPSSAPLAPALIPLIAPLAIPSPPDAGSSIWPLISPSGQTITELEGENPNVSPLAGPPEQWIPRALSFRDSPAVHPSPAQGAPLIAPLLIHLAYPEYGAGVNVTATPVFTTTQAGIPLWVWIVAGAATLCCCILFFGLLGMYLRRRRRRSFEVIRSGQIIKWDKFGQRGQRRSKRSGKSQYLLNEDILLGDGLDHRDAEMGSDWGSDDDECPLDEAVESPSDDHSEASYRAYESDEEHMVEPMEKNRKDAPKKALPVDDDDEAHMVEPMAKMKKGAAGKKALPVDDD